MVKEMERRQSDVSVSVDTDQGKTTVRQKSSTTVSTPVGGQQQRRLAYDVTPIQALSSHAVLSLPHHDLGPTAQINASQVFIQLSEPSDAGPSRAYHGERDAYDDCTHHPVRNTYFLRSMCRHSGHPTCLLDHFFEYYKPDITHHYDLDFGMYFGGRSCQSHHHRRRRRA